MRRTLLATVAGLAALLAWGPPAAAQGAAQGGAQGGGQEINLYSSRHYDADRLLYDAFTKETGIRVRVVEGNADQIIERLRNEGANSPADVLMMVDAARLARAKEAGLFQPVTSATLEERIPAELQDPDNQWFAFTRRARVVMYDKRQGRPEGLTRYEDLADPRFRGQICVRSGAHPYNTSLAASVLAANGPEQTEAWARGVVANFARPPQGGDRDQFRAIPSGQCRLAISNTYYLGHFGLSEKPEDKELFERIGVIFPNQAAGDRGAAVNVSGAGLVKSAPNRAAGLRFLEYLSTPEAQRLFAQSNMEYPVVPGVQPHPALVGLGDFRGEPVDGKKAADNTAEALRLVQRAGWQ